MDEQKTGGFHGRMALTILYGMLCAIEVRGYYLARAGKSVLDIPYSWKYVYGAFCLWLCWELLAAEYRKGGIVPALWKATFECAGIILFINKTLLGIAGHKILEPPSTWETALYGCATAILVWITFLWKPKKEYHSGTVDRCAILSLAVLFITKIGMHFAAGHDAIVLKCMGCIAIGIGTIWMALGQLNAFFPEESEFPAIPASLSGSTSSEARSRTINGEELISQEKPLGLRRLARLDHGGEGRRTQAYRQNF
jgi:hypothetical protein